MPIKILQASLHSTRLRTRMPFRYGIATMTQVPMVFARLVVEVGGRTATGIASDLLPPKWFTKIPEKPIEEETAEMLAVIRHALKASVGLEDETAFALWQQLFRAQDQWGQQQQWPPLLVHFGTSLVERALIEAVGRAFETSFREVLRHKVLGIALGDIHGELRGLAPVDLLPPRPLPTVTVRHTIGMLDPLTEAEIKPSERLEDGLPQSLEACIRAYGLRHFKIKLHGNFPRDVERLHGIADVLEATATPEFAFSLDGNEQFTSAVDFRAYWEELAAEPRLWGFWRHLLFVEQPLHRDAALRPEVEEIFRAWTERPPLIIDESDANLDSMVTALRLGYDGTSHKNCKGVFKSIANRCLLLKRRQEPLSRPLLMSGEDLCNIGPVALLQDLAVTAALGIASVERNGHHYHAGLSQFPREVQEQVLAAHPDLYQPSRQGWPTLRIQGGQIEIGSVNRHALGVGFELGLEAFSQIFGEAVEVESRQ